MRGLFLTLLSANLAVFAWGQWLAPRDAAGSGSAPALEVPRIMLASEAPVGAAAATAVDASNGDGGLGAGGTGDAALGEAGLPTDGAGAGVAEGAIAGAGQAAAQNPAEAARCVSVGPMVDLDAAAKVTGILVEAGYGPRQRPADGQVPDGYGVLVPDLATAEDQARVQRILTRGGLTDAATLAERSAVSVGLFTQRNRAERRAEVVRKLGLKPVIEDRRRAGTVYWVDIDLKSEAGSASIDAMKLSDSGLQIVPCPPPL